MANGPYDPKILKPPLTAIQRQRIVAWLLGQYLKVGGLPTPEKIRTMTDAQLITLYTNTYTVEGVGAEIGHEGIDAGKDIASGVMTTAQFLEKLGEFIFNPVRMGEMIVGVILIGVGLNAVTRGAFSRAASAPVRVASAPYRAASASARYAQETQRQAARSFAISHAREAGRAAAKGAK